MKLTNIVNLYIEMRKSNQFRQQFDFTYNEITADVMFLIDQTPFILLFGIKNTREYFEIEMKEGFRVPNYLDPMTFNLIKRIFKIKYDPQHIYKPADFWNAFNSKIPKHVCKTKPAVPSSIAYYRKDVEESNKIYFCGFKDNNKLGQRVRNLEKTRKLMGEKAYQRCKKENLSTRWTDKPSKDLFENWEKLLK